MNVAPAVADWERTRSPSERKRLGQYFTGLRVARLLATLAGAKGAKTILDPMVGSGDMLVGAMAAGARPDVLAGIDIDSACIALAAARSETAHATMIQGDAFALATVAALPLREWDLVITNPPYVRYQATSSRGGINPSASEVRTQLRRTIVEFVQPSDRAIFAALVDGYSGLADLAVPAWLLSAALVAPGGTLAMVVPETWLSRDYATVVRYLLARCFQVEFVIRDIDAVWFKDALLRTSLLVARRIKTRSSAFSLHAGGGYIEATVDREAIDDRSVVGRMHPRAIDADRAFERELQRWRRIRPTHHELPHGTVSWIPADHIADEVRRRVAGSRWLSVVEPEAVPAPSQRSVVPVALRNVVTSDPGRSTTLAELGWNAGQGLRTGANVFFYCDLVGEHDDISRVRVSAALGGGELDVPSSTLLPVLRSQAELPERFAVSARAITGRVLALSGFALPEDISGDPELAPYQPLSDPLAGLVRQAARTNIGSSEAPRFVPQLTAVRTNVRMGSRNGTTKSARFWYQLPPMTARHRPELIVARVNHGHPRFLANRDASLIDANFSTLWRENESVSPDRPAMLAMLNSIWIRAALELSGTVLGGGALKVEATQIRRLPIPVLSSATWAALSQLGRALMRVPKSSQIGVLREIDEQVLHVGLRLTTDQSGAVAAIARSALAGRSG